MIQPAVVGRLAPSPTGALHLGNARSFLLAWLSARQQQGRLLLRIEDIDSPRVKPWAVASTIDDLQWLGLDWDAGPEGPSPDCELSIDVPLVQSLRLGRYREVLQGLIDRNRVYRCTCTRTEVAESASAPHETALKPLEGPIYPGTCRSRAAKLDLQREMDGKFAWRWAFEDEQLRWVDRIAGEMRAWPARQLGDFVIARGDGTPAYQLAVVVDDHDMGVSEVVRGDDLIFSTFRQVAILRALQWAAPEYIHVPLVVGPDGRRLAKRHGDTRLRFFREQDVTPEAILGYLAWSLHLLDHLQPVTARELVGSLEWSKLPKEATVFELQSGMQELLRLSR